MSPRSRAFCALAAVRLTPITFFGQSFFFQREAERTTDQTYADDGNRIEHLLFVFYL